MTGARTTLGGSGPVDTSPTPDVAVNRSTLREQVLEALRTMITSGGVRPGATLLETELAARFQVSRGTVREALRALQQARLVAGDARGRLRVHLSSPEEIAEIFAVRSALEGLAARLIVARSDRDECVAKLREVLPPEALTEDFSVHMNIDLGFHERLCELAGNQTLVQNWRSLQDRMRIVFFSSGETTPVPIMSRGHHQPIVDAIASGDPDNAVRTLSAHMNQASQRWAPGVAVLPPH